MTDWFDGRIAVELRLWEAIDQGFLVPFQYFGVADGIDLRQSPGGAAAMSSTSSATSTPNDDPRVSKLLAGHRTIVLDPATMRASRFCVSKEHARYMARKFTEAGLESVALTGDDPAERRTGILNRLQAGRLRCVFSVEVLGEGVDVPDVDCLLLLRPTESATLFTQQLGRGLRRAEGKSHLTVIDLIGQHRKEFRFEDRLQGDRRPARDRFIDQVEGRFSVPPAWLLGRPRSSEPRRIRRTTSARPFGPLALGRPSSGSCGVDAGRRTSVTFLDQTGHRLEDVYRSGDSWTQLRRDAGLVAGRQTRPGSASSCRTLGRHAPHR